MFVDSHVGKTARLKLQQLSQHIANLLRMTEAHNTFGKATSRCGAFSHGLASSVAQDQSSLQNSNGDHR